MNLKASLTHLSTQDTPDDEERADAPQESLQGTSESEKVGTDAGVATQGGGTTDEDEDDNDEDDSNQGYSDPHVDLDNQPGVSRRLFSRILSSVFPAPSNEEEIQAYIPHYRLLPILSGVTIPFSILLEIPGLTEDWYILTDGSTIVASKPNPLLLDIGIAFSILFAVLANVCLVVRFLESRIKVMTILCTLFLSIHDAINVVALATFGAMKDGYTFSHAFWMTLCSTIVSSFTNVTIIVDLIRTPDFKRSGSGLTRRQRSLVIIIIGLFCYLALGALVNSLLLDLTFINGLYFTVVTIETIGFGDIVPKTSGSRVFVCIYATLGVLTLAFVVGYVRETVLEGLDFGYRKRLLAIQERRRISHRRRQAEKRWRHAIIWRLRERRAPVWVSKNKNGHESFWSHYFWRPGWKHTPDEHPRGMQLNLWALPRSQLEAAALEAGVPLDTLLPANFYETYNEDTCSLVGGVERRALPSWFVAHPVYHTDEPAASPLTHRRLGAMAAIVTKLGFFVYESGGSPLQTGTSATGPSMAAQESSGSFQTSASEEGRDYRADVMDTEKKAYYTRSGLSWGWFLIFWMGGAAIFKATEGWTYGMALYFCFISFSTIGYGDLTPTTPAGRSVFVVWALIGVATITIFISVVSEAYTSRYKGILGRNSFKQSVQQYRERNKAELTEKVQRIGTSTGVKFVLSETFEREETDVQFAFGEFPPASASVDDTTMPNIASTSKSQPHVHHAQQSLEQLPGQILTETRTIQQYMQLISDVDGHPTNVQRSVQERVSYLIDDIMSGRNLNDTAKMDILKDGECRQTLMTLGVERSLKELVDISERAIAAIRERDRVIAMLERERGQDEAEDGQSD